MEVLRNYGNTKVNEVLEPLIPPTLTRPTEHSSRQDFPLFRGLTFLDSTPREQWIKAKYANVAMLSKQLRPPAPSSPATRSALNDLQEFKNMLLQVLKGDPNFRRQVKELLLYSDSEEDEVEVTF